MIDSRAPRANQLVVAIVAFAAITIGPWWLVAILAAQFAVGLRFGRRFCLPCVAYFEFVQPLFGEGPLEDARPPRVANLIGLLFLAASTLTFAAGLHTAGIVLAAIVGALALTAALTGFCAGCRAFKIACLLRGQPFVSCPIPKSA